MLTLNEKLLLLALDAETGKFLASVDMGIAACTLIDLIEAGRLTNTDDGVIVLDESPLGKEPHDFALARIAGAKRTYNLQHWISDLATYHFGEIRQPVLRSLVEAGLVEERREKVLWVFDVARFPEHDGRPEAELVARLREILLGGAQPDAHEALLILLAHTCTLDHAILPEKEERKQARARIEEIEKSDFAGADVGAAAKACKEALDAAVAACVIVTAG